MSFNRLTYDSCAYSKTLQQSTDPLEYNLFLGKFESCNDCSLGDFPINLDFGTRSDVESDLKGHTRIGSKCANEKFPNNTIPAAPLTPAVTCANIYNILPVNTGYPSNPPVPLLRPTSSGLKDINSYGQNSCPLK